MLCVKGNIRKNISLDVRIPKFQKKYLDREKFKPQKLMQFFMHVHEKLDPFRKLNLRETTKLLNRMHKKICSH